jgi:ABC-type glycerol-3-phosphate transport system substrate-binding protein
MDQPLYQAGSPAVTDTPPPVPPPAPVSPPPPSKPDFGSFSLPDTPPPPPPVGVSPPPPSAVSIIETAPSGRSSKPFIIFGILLAVCLIAALVFSTFTKFKPFQSTVTITYWGLWESQSTMKNLISEYETSHPKVKINYIQQNPNEYRERLSTAINQNRGPDIFRFHNTWTPMLKGFLAPLPPEVFSPQEFESSFYPVALKDLRLGGSYIGIPLEIDGLIMFVNDDLFKPTGLPVPKDWDELHIAANALARCDTPTGKCTPNARILVAGAGLGSTQNVDHWEDILAVLMLQNNVNLAQPHLPDATPAKDAISYFNSFSQNDFIWSSNLPTSTSLFAAGKLGIYFAPSWRVFDILALNSQLKFSAYPLPQLPIDPVKNEREITYASYWVEGVNNKSKVSAEAWSFLKFISSRDSMQKLYTQSISPQRPFGEPYSRVDLASQIQSAPLVGPVITQGPWSTSWYLASFTYDGPKGINTRLSDAYAKAVNGQVSLSETSTTITQILAEYGIQTSAP